jgi:hypothetical protein
MSMSQLPRQDTEFGRTTERLFGTSGFPWWWHTLEDTIDKIDGAVLTQDTRVYVATALRLANAPVLPLGHARAARAVADSAAELHAAAAGRFDLSPVVQAARDLARALADQEPRLAALGAPGAAAAAADRTLMRLSRVLVPLLYTGGDRFDHDLAVGIPPLAGLDPARRLTALDAGADATRFQIAALVRERNRVLHALDRATELAEELSHVPGGR